MRFLLINPYYSISETPSPPLGLAFLAAALEKTEIEVKILDFVVFPYSREYLESELNDFDPHLVGVTSVTMTFDDAITVINDVKKINPGILTVMGGPHVTFCVSETMSAFPALDFIVLGEGEETIVELARAVEKQQDPSTIKGLVCRTDSGIINTGFRDSLVDVNTLPVPARHLLPLGRYRALGMAISMTTSRGCPFQCIFCVGRKMVGAKVRYRNAQSVVDELEYLNTLGFSQINIADDLFIANTKHCIHVCDEILKRNLLVKWTSFARVDTVSRSVLKKMKEAGCYTVSFGVESANAEILKTIKKGINIQQVIDAINLCNEVGMMSQVSFILGLPGETPETLEETIQFGEKLKDMGVFHGFHHLAPFPGTAVREQSGEYGIQILTNDWSQYHANKAIVETASVTRNMLNERVAEWEKEFKDWLDNIKKDIDQGKAKEDEVRQYRNLERTVLIYDLMMGRCLEDAGSWPAEAFPDSLEDAKMALARRLADTTKYFQEDIFNALSYTMEQGNLECAEEKGKIQWRWVDRL